MMPDKNTPSVLLAERIIKDAGGEVTGRIRLQKIVFLMSEMGFLRDMAEPLSFNYHHYGPYSEAFAEGLDYCAENNLLEEETKKAGWGSEYYIYRLPQRESEQENLSAESADGGNEAKQQEKAFVQIAKERSSVLLELAATALYLYKRESFDKRGNAWAETKSRKQVKARDGRLKKAFELYEELRNLPSPQPLPEIPFMF